jgi:hypothetical protein
MKNTIRMTKERTASTEFSSPYPQKFAQLNRTHVLFPGIEVYTAWWNFHPTAMRFLELQPRTLAGL